MPVLGGGRSAGGGAETRTTTIAAGETKQVALFPAGATILRLSVERTSGAAAAVGDEIVVHDGAGRLIEWECTSLDPVEAWEERELPDAQPGEPHYYLAGTRTIDANGNRLLPSATGWLWQLPGGDVRSEADTTVSFTSSNGGELTVTAKWLP